MFCFSVISIVKFTVWLLSFFLITYTGYYFIIALFSFQSCKPLKSFAPENRFAILIAARNEAQVI
ncbi:MAG: hypothetical protein AAGU75_07935, partial [Bacillota bacterium]